MTKPKPEYWDASGRRRLCRPEWNEWATPAYGSERVLDLGCSHRQRPEASARYCAVDISRDRNPMVLADAHRLPFRAGSVDVVLMYSLLEHVHDPPAVVAEARRVLRPGGKAHLFVPFLHFRHDAVDYYRWTEEGLRHLLRDFRILKVERAYPGFFSVCFYWLLKPTYLWPRPLAVLGQSVLRALLWVSRRADVGRSRFYFGVQVEAEKA